MNKQKSQGSSSHKSKPKQNVVSYGSKQIRKLSAKQQMHSSQPQEGKDYYYSKPEKETLLRQDKTKNHYLKNASNHKNDNCFIMNIEQKHQIARKQTNHRKRQMMPEIIKHIEQNCKILKHIHEQKESQKRGRLISKQLYRVENQTCFYRKLHQREQIHCNQSQATKINKCSPAQNQKFQHYIPKVPKSKIKMLFSEKVQRNSAVIEKVNKQTAQKQEKSGQVDEAKVQKSKNTTNYNTNQSKNSSSVVNYHGYSGLMVNSQILWNKQAKIAQLIKSQQKNINYDQRRMNRTFISNDACLNNNLSEQSQQDYLDRHNHQSQFIKTAQAESLKQQECFNGNQRHFFSLCQKEAFDFAKPISIIPASLFQFDSIKLPRSQIYKIHINKFKKLLAFYQKQRCFQKYSRELCRTKLDSKFTYSKYFVPIVPKSNHNRGPEDNQTKRKPSERLNIQDKS